jgi:hypothetical protein
VGDELKIGALLEDAAPHLFVVTISGADADSATKGWGKLIQTLDQGTFDVSTVLRKLRDLKYAGPIGLQHYGIKGDSKENLARSMAGWKTVSAKATGP